MASKPRQLSFLFKTRGGLRTGAGRKPKGTKAGAPHTRRPPLHRRHPVHVTIRLLPGLPSLRTRRMYAVIRRAFLLGGGGSSGGGSGSGGSSSGGSGSGSGSGSCGGSFRICHYSIMSNHMHLICEAAGREALSRGMQGLSIRLSKGINRVAVRTGRVFAERYHGTALTSPTQVRSTLRYVLNNLRKHAAERGEKLSSRFVDSYSSAVVFDGWRQWWAGRPTRGEPEPNVAGAMTWLLSVGWRKAGLIGVAEVPGPRA